MRLRTILALCAILSYSLSFADESAMKAQKDKKIEQKTNMLNMGSDSTDSLLTFLNQNQGGFIQNKPDLAHYLLNHHLVLSALANLDVGMSSRHPASDLNTLGRYDGKSSAAAALSETLLYMDAKIIEGLTSHVSLLYQNNRGIFQRYDQDSGLSTFPNENGISTPQYARSDFSIDEAFARFANFNVTPLFIEAGRFYQPFGYYEVHPLTQTLPQQLSQVRGDGAELGIATRLPDNWGNIEWVGYLFKGAERPLRSIHRDKLGFGTQLSYRRSETAYGYVFDVGYLNDMNLVNFIATSTPYTNLPENMHRVGAIALDWLAYAGPFDTHLNFVSALEHFNPNSVQYTWDEGATPKAIDLGTGYRFDLFSHDSRFGVSYQHSWQASRLGLGSDIAGAGLPKHRVQGDYTLQLLQYLRMQLQLRYDKDYDEDRGASHRDSVTGLVRFSVGLA